LRVAAGDLWSSGRGDAAPPTSLLHRGPRHSLSAGDGGAARTRCISPTHPKRYSPDSSMSRCWPRTAIRPARAPAARLSRVVVKVKNVRCSRITRTLIVPKKPGGLAAAPRRCATRARGRHPNSTPAGTAWRLQTCDSPLRRDGRQPAAATRPRPLSGRRRI
jgi:hypothetical protein